MLKTKPTEEMKDSAGVVETVKGGETAVSSQPEVISAAQNGSEVVDDGAAGASTAEVVDNRTAQMPANPQQNLPVSASVSSGLSGILADLTKSGFTGVGIEFGTFPLLSLDKGDFKVNEKDLGRITFQCTPLASTPKYCYRNTGASQKEEDTVWSDTPDAHFDPESAVSKKIKEWSTKNWGWEQKEYLNVLAHVFLMPNAPELENTWVMLSVPPTSKKAFSGAAIKCKTHGYDPHECLFEVSVGDKIKGAQFDWNPWVFNVKGSLRKFNLSVSLGTRNEDF